MSKFDMGEFAKVLASVPNSDTNGREQIEYIDISLLDEDSRNFYELSGLDALASNIALVGLQDPLRVRSTEDGRYTVLSGHRRRAALWKLVQEGMEQFRQVPCIRETSPDSPALQELKLIYANSDTRVMSSADISKQAERVEMLLYRSRRRECSSRAGCGITWHRPARSLRPSWPTSRSSGTSSRNPSRASSSGARSTRAPL